MTKTLTEQWREGTLESGHYYIQWSFDCDPRPRNMIDFFDKEYSDGGEFMLQQHKYIEEVLAPVPSYDEHKELVSKTEQLEKKLEIATKALKDMPEMSMAQRALREMEGVK
jgi:hypothetical protein